MQVQWQNPNNRNNRTTPIDCCLESKQKWVPSYPAQPPVELPSPPSAPQRWWWLQQIMRKRFKVLLFLLVPRPPPTSIRPIKQETRVVVVVVVVNRISLQLLLYQAQTQQLEGPSSSRDCQNLAYYVPSNDDSRRFLASLCPIEAVLSTVMTTSAQHLVLVISAHHGGMRVLATDAWTCHCELDPTRT